MTEAKKDKLLNPVKLAAGAGAAVTAAVAGSVFGDSGTIAGVALGSVISGSAAAVYEHGALTAHQRAKKKLQRRRELLEHEYHTAMFRQLHPGMEPPPPPRKRRKSLTKPLLIGAGTLAAGCVLGFGGISAVEAATGKTLHGLTTGANDSGYSVGSHQSNPTPSDIHRATPTPAGTPATSGSPSSAGSPSPEPVSTPDLTPAVPSVTVPSEPSGTTSPSAEPTGLPTPVPAVTGTGDLSEVPSS